MKTISKTCWYLSEAQKRNITLLGKDYLGESEALLTGFVKCSRVSFVHAFRDGFPNRRLGLAGPYWGRQTLKARLQRGNDIHGATMSGIRGRGRRNEIMRTAS